MAVVGIAALPFAPTSSAGAAAVSTRQSVAVPAYFYPGGTNLAYWDQLRGSASSVAITVATGLKLEGSAPDSNYQAQLTRLHNAGVRTLAYISTSGGAKSLAQAGIEIDRAYAWYGVDGIFFDEAVAYPVTCAQVSYYNLLNQRVKAKGGPAVTVINNGQILPECYAATVDILLTAETDYAGYKAWQPWGWEKNYPASKFWHLIHGVDTVDKMHEVIALSRARNAGYVFATSGSTNDASGPFGSLPPNPYWSNELSTVAQPVALAATPTTTTPPATAPTVSPTTVSFSPVSGPPATTVVIFGRGLSRVVSVNLAGAPVKIVSVSDTAISVRLNSWNTSGSFTVNFPGGVATTTGGRFSVT